MMAEALALHTEELPTMSLVSTVCAASAPRQLAISLWLDGGAGEAGGSTPPD